MESAGLLSTTIAAAALVVAHLAASRLHFLHRLPRSRWLSFAGGVSVGYVFGRILPELAKAQRAFEEAPLYAVAWLEQHVYLLALAGLVVFYALARAVQQHRAGLPATEAPATDAVFWLHMASFALYNGLIGYLLNQQAGAGVLAWFTFGVGMHFLVTDYGLGEDHAHLYHRYGRWLLAAAILVGWAAGAMFHAPERVVAALLGFLSGAIVLNAIKEELPRERESRVWPFVAGAALYAVILVASR